MERLGPAIALTALIFVYYFFTSRLGRRLWSSRRISSRTLAFIVAGRLYAAFLVICLVSPLIFDVAPGAAVTGAALVGVVLVVRLAVAVRMVPSLDDALANPQQSEFSDWTRTEKWIVGAVVTVLGVAAFGLTVLLIALSSTH